jgi:exopolyphosphatase/guanosine-5'-triphosphate,3'-diphosphate pyrophosphatase
MACLAAIDIGSNALRLRIARAERPSDGPAGPRFLSFEDVVNLRASVRLGHGVFRTGALDDAAIDAACEALKGFRDAMDAAGVVRSRAVATSAAREASNGAVFVERALREAGVAIELIDGDEEATLLRAAVLERVPLGERAALLVDVGGGSTELTLLHHGRTLFSRSLPVGAVRILESFIDGAGVVTLATRQRIEAFIDEVMCDPLRDIAELRPGGVDCIIGSGGNVETLAGVCPVVAEGPRSIDVAGAMAWLAELSAKSVEQRVAAYGLRPDRADTIIAATVILGHVARVLGQAHIVAPGVGLKEGVLLGLARAHFGGSASRSLA